jgi:hypothetical protein
MVVILMSITVVYTTDVNNNVSFSQLRWVARANKSGVFEQRGLAKHIDGKCLIAMVENA